MTSCRAIAVFGVGIEIAHHHEGCLAPGRPEAGIVRQFNPVEVVDPEPDLVGVAEPVPVFRPVEDRWRRMAREDMEPPARQVERHVPVGLRGEAHRVRRFIAREETAARKARALCVGKVLPEELRESPRLLRDDGIARQEEHAVLPREAPEAERVIRCSELAVAVQIVARKRAGIGWGGEAVGVGRPGLREAGDEEVGRATFHVVVELVDQKDVGRRFGNDRDHRVDLVVVPAEIGDEPARARPVERGVEGRDPDRLGNGWKRGEKRRREGRDQRPRARRTSQPTLMRAAPRMIRLAGRKAQSVQPQISGW